MLTVIKNRFFVAVSAHLYVCLLQKTKQFFFSLLKVAVNTILSSLTKHAQTHPWNKSSIVRNLHWNWFMNSLHIVISVHQALMQRNILTSNSTLHSDAP